MRYIYTIRGSSGVTLLESMVAIMLVAMSLGIILATFTVSRSTAPELRNRTIALNFIREKIEDAKGMAFGSIVSQNYQQCVLDDRGTPNDPGDDLLSDEFYIGVVNEFDCKNVTVVMKWTESRGDVDTQREESLITLIANH